MKKRIFPFLLCFAVFFIIFPAAVQADVGPKPSVVIDFKGLEKENYYVTLLSESRSTGPYTAYSESSGPPRYTEDDEDFDIWRKFASYKDADGYFFLQFFCDCSETSRFQWAYYPPAKFKVLIYFPERDSFILSGEIYERYAFDSYYTARVVKGAAGAVSGVRLEKSYNFKWEIISLLARIAATIGIELAVGLLFGFRDKRRIRIVFIANIITQSSLNIALNIINYEHGGMAFVLSYILMEFLVFGAEAAIYLGFLNRGAEKAFSKKRIVFYALVANIVSFFMGIYISWIVPGIF